MNFRSSPKAVAVAVSAALLCVEFNAVAAQATHKEFCGFGPPRSSTDYERYWDRIRAQRAVLGYDLFCEAALDQSDFSRFAKPKTTTRGRLVFKPVDLSNTAFSSFVELGELPEHRGDEGDLALRRYFRTDTGLIVSVFEWAIAQTGGSVQYPDKGRTVPISGRAARLTQIQTRSGKSYSDLSWTDGTFYLTVSIRSPGPARDQLQYLTELAESLAKAYARHPRERPGGWLTLSTDA